MGKVINLDGTKRTHDKQVADVYYQLLLTCKKYILFAQEKGVYEGIKHDGNEVAKLIDRLKDL